MGLTLYSRCARRPLPHGREESFRWNTIDIHVLVLIRNAGHCAVACPSPLNSVEDHAGENDEEDGAQGGTESDEYGNAY